MDNSLRNLIQRLSYKNIAPFPNGYILVGANSSGKTYSMEKTLQSLIKECQYNLIYIPEYMQDINTDVVLDNPKSSISLDQNMSDILRDIHLITDERISSIQKDDQEKDIISKFILKNIIHGKSEDHTHLKAFFKEILKCELYWDNKIKIKFLTKSKGDYLTSSGYKAMIRIVTEIYMSINKMNENRKNDKIIVFIDEIDAKLYWENREFFLNELYYFITNIFEDVKFIISTHMPETVASAPEGFSIIKFLHGEEITFKEYHSEDFLTIDQVEKVIFDKNKSIIKESESLKRLKEIYFECLKCTTGTCTNYTIYTCKNFLNTDLLKGKTTKEQIIYNAINSLQRR